MTMHERETFSSLLRRHRLAAGLSQQALAERAGLSTDAVAALESGRRKAPRAETLALLVAALHLDPAGADALVNAATVTRTLGTQRSSLPPAAAQPAPLAAPPTPLLGREGEVAAVVQLLQNGAQTRLLTLVGPGGVGKTRLALAVAADLRDAYRDGVVVVDLSALRDPRLVIVSLAQALGVRESGDVDVRTLLLAYLQDRHQLVVLDNFEQVVDAAPVVVDVVATCPHLTILVTSRTALRVRGEQLFSVPPLVLPAVQQGTALQDLATYPAVQLFVARARAIRPDFVLRDDNAATIAAICRRLDGLPLAIELAAARTLLLPPAALLQRLERRLETLSGGARDLPERQRTLRATIAWSYELLSVEEQALFRRVALFAGGCSLSAVEAMTPDSAGVLETLGSLVDKSLVRVDDVMDADPRIVMLETIREYGLDQLDASGEAPALRRAHAHYYLDMAETADADLKGSSQALWLARLERELANLRAALAWAEQHEEADLGLRLATGLWQFWYARGYLSEGRAWLERLLALNGGSASANRVRARALLLAGTLATEQADYGRAMALCTESSALCDSLGDAWGLAWAFNIRGAIAHHKGEPTVATSYYEESLSLFRQLDDGWATAIVLNNLGAAARDQRHYARAQNLYEESLALQRTRNDSWGIALLLDNLGEVARDRGAYAQAAALSHESLALRRQLGDKGGMAEALINLGRIATAEGDYEHAWNLYAESMALCRDAQERSRIATCLEGLAGAACGLGRPTGAARILGSAAALRDNIGVPCPPADTSDYDRTMNAVRGALTDADFLTHWTAGRALAPDQVIDGVLTQATGAPATRVTSASVPPEWPQDRAYHA